MEKDPLILLIDDEPQILRALKTILTGNHFRVITAPTGNKGCAATQSPDVIISDLTLPDMDGIRVCEEIGMVPHTNHCAYSAGWRKR